HSLQTDLGGRYSTASQGLPCRCAGCQARSSPPALDTGRKRAGQRQMAHHQRRTGTKGKLKARFAAVRVRVADTAAADQGQGSATSARRRGLVDWRTKDVGREEILSCYLANLPTNTGLLQAFSPPVGALSSAFSFFRQ